MKRSRSMNSVSMLIFTIIATVAFSWMVLRAPVEGGNPFVFGMPSSEKVVPAAVTGGDESPSLMATESPDSSTPLEAEVKTDDAMKMPVEASAPVTEETEAAPDVSNQMPTDTSKPVEVIDAATSGLDDTVEKMKK